MYPMKKLDLEKDEWIAFINQGLEEITDLAHVVSPSIFMAPSPLRGLKLESFLPQVVAIGPYHNEMGPHHSNFPQTAETERYKLIAAKEMEKYKILAARETAKNFKRNHFKFLIEEFLKVLDQVRQEYGSDFECESDEALAYTLGLDASFVIEVLRCSGETKDSLSGFGAFYAGRFPRPLRKSIIQDFMLLENQIPLFLLQKVIRAHMNCHSDDDADGTLGSLISKAATEVLPFSGLSPGSLRSVVHDLGSRKHLLDCLYCISTFTSSAIGKTEIVEKPTQFPTAVELYNSGISFGRTEGNATDVRFDEKKGVLHLPKVRVGDETEKLFRNLIAYESHLVDKVEVLSYLRFMNCLVDTPGDVALLAEKGVIVQDIGSNEGVADMWNNLCMNTMRVCSGEYEKVAIALNRHSKRKVNALMAEFKRTYLSRPWLVVSLVSGIALLIMTFLIMWYTIELYYNK